MEKDIEIKDYDHANDYVLDSNGVVAVCSECHTHIYSDESYYEIDGKEICTDCIGEYVRKCKKTVYA
jgi:hypothetical protein